MTAPDQSATHPDLFPEIEPYDQGYLRVGDLHEIYWEQVGNPQGKPLFILHGGPGAGCSPAYRCWADPGRFHMVLHDQRGAGRSRPFGELRENTTQALVEDIEKLRRHLGVESMLLLGGSWGSTLALAYAETYPERVSGLILRGIFLATQEESDFFPDGAALYFPEAFERLRSQIPEMPGQTLPRQVLALLESPDEEVRKRAARAWSMFELRISFLRRSDEEVESILKSWDPVALAKIETWYMAHDFFLEEGELVRGLERIRHVPAVILNGRYDMATPPVVAWRLHKALPKSEIRFVEASGHSAGDWEMQGALVWAVKRMDLISG
jgi:proline iminopeptidase